MLKIGSEKWNDSMYSLHPTPYHNLIAGIIERQRVKIIKKLANIKPNDAVLEIGCEQGYLLSKLPKSKKIVGLDISGKAIRDAAERLGKKVKLIRADAQKKINLNKESFDVIICSQTLEHVQYPEKIMENIYRLSKHNARIIISVPNEVFLTFLKKILLKIWPLSKLLHGIEHKQSEWHLQTFTDSTLRQLVKKHFAIKAAKRTFNIYLIYSLTKKDLKPARGIIS